MTPPPVWLDVTETLASGLRTGIQRVTIELARAVLEQSRGRLIRYHFKTRAFVELTDDETASLFRPSARSTSVWQRWAARWRLTAFLGLLKDACLALPSLRRAGPAFAWQGGTYLTTEVLGNLARYRAVRRLPPKVSTVLVLHDLFPLTAPEFSSLRRRAFARHWRLVLRASRVIAVSEHTRREALRYAEARRQCLPPVSVAHPGYSLGEAVESLPDRTPPEFFLCVGTLERRKNQAGLLAAFKHYRAAGGRAHLVFVGGEGPGSDGLVRTIEAAGRSVIWYRRADDAVLKGLYRRAVALVYPSLAEGFGLPLVEALALGTPCVTSNRTSTVEVAELCGGTLVVDPEDEGALATALLSFDQPGFRDRLVATIRADRIPTWKAFADKVVTAPHPLKLIFDVSSLGYAALGPQHRTGLFRVAAAYGQELRRHPDVQLGLYTASGNRLWAADWLRGLGWNSQPWVGSSTAALVCLGAQALEFAVYRSPLRPATGAFTALRKATEALRARVDRRALATWQAYLSPREAVPLSVRRSSLTTAVVIHDLIPLVLPEYRQDPADPTRWFSALWQSVAPTDLVFTVSEATKRDWSRLRPAFPADRVTVAPNAIDHSRFHGALVSSRSAFFLAVSTVEPRKRFDAVLAAYCAYRAAGGQTPLFLVGEDKGHLLKPSEGVTLLGFADEAELPLLYAGCQAFVSLSEYEGFGLPILEAMACGAPVVVSNRSSHPEVAGEAGLYVEPDDVEAVARALASLDDPAARNNAARRSLAQAQKFRWDLTVATVVKRIVQEREHQGDAP